VKADRVLLSGDGATGFTGIVAQAGPGSSGNAGDLTVRTGSLEVREGAQISASTFGSGDGGELLVEADMVFLSDSGPPGLVASANSTGDAGNLTVRAGSLEVRNGAEISTSTSGAGKGGNITIKVKGIVSIIGESGVFSGTFKDSSGDAGDIVIEAKSVVLSNGALVFSSTFGIGNGGNITVTATDSVSISGRQRVPSTIVSNTLGAGKAGHIFISTPILMMEEGTILTNSSGEGDAGEIVVEVQSLTLTNGARIDSSTSHAGQGGNITITASDSISIVGRNSDGFPSSLFSGTNGPSLGGTIAVTARDIDLADGGIISAESTSTDLDIETNPDTGLSGSIPITATDTLQLLNGSSISVQTESANAGNIDLSVGNLLHLRDQSSITTSVAGGTGDGGNITIDPVFTVLDGASEIVARAREGSGGNIRITTDFLFQSPDSLIDASSEFGVSGTVEIDSPDTDITGGITTLPESFFDAAALL
jgi:large exoprotein involved in heme utilization and adhesion